MKQCILLFIFTILCALIILWVQNRIGIKRKRRWDNFILGHKGENIVPTFFDIYTHHSGFDIYFKLEVEGLRFRLSINSIYGIRYEEDEGIKIPLIKVGKDGNSVIYLPTEMKKAIDNEVDNCDNRIAVD